MRVCVASVGILLALVVAPAHASSNLDTSAVVYILCNTQSYSNGSTFSEELSSVLQTLQKEASSAPYFSTQEDTVVGAYQCRGDLSLDTCSQCVNSAAQSALSSCPNAIGSRVQLDGCFLRYENYSFFVEDSSVVVELCNTQKDNSSSFQTHVTQLLRQVTNAAPNNKLLYASARSALTSSSANASSNYLYALAQCLNYLSPAACARCLAAHSSSWQDCEFAVGAQVHSVSCYYRFEIYPFYDLS